MSSVRITKSTTSPDETTTLVGAPVINKKGVLERSVNLPVMVYDRIEAAVADGHIEGDVYLEDRSRFHWFLDR